VKNSFGNGRVRWFPLAVFALLAAPGLLDAQVNASISGKVQDATGTGIDGATVTVKSLDTGATRTATTGSSGNFRLLSLPIGPQEVRVEKSGFKTAVREGINPVVSQEAVLTLSLEVGQFSDQVTVTDEAPLINTSTSSVSGLVGERQVKDLPLNGRSFDNLITLNPSAINYGLKSQNTSTSNGNTFSVAGRRPADNLVMLNGIEYTGSSQLAITPGGVSGDLLGIEAVREFTVQTDTYGAEYGKRSGGQVSVVTQSGTNSLHGSLFEFLRNSALDDRSLFAQTSSPPPFRQNQFGAALGGPLKKDKLFLFGNWEGFRQALTQSSLSVVPDAQVRQGSFPNATTGVYAPVANLNKNMLPYFAFWPAANGVELTVNGLPSGTAFSYNTPKQNIREDFGTLRSDYNLRERDTLSASYTIDDGDSLIPMADPLFASATRLRMQVGSVQETHIVSPNILNTFRAGFSRAAFNLDASQGSFPTSLSFVNGLLAGGIVVNGGVTTSGLSGITAAGSNNAAGSWNRRNLFTFSDGVQISKGRHQISAGVWFQRIQDNEDSASRTTGVATFASLTTFLQSTTSQFQVVPQANELGWRSLFGAWYVQDTIRLRRNLTLTAGLRHEFTTGWNEVSNRAANYVPDANGVIQTNPLVGSSAFTKNNATKLFGPRIGLAWDPRGNGKTAIRAGFGIYYSLIDDLSFLLNSLPPANGSLTSSGSLFNLIPVFPSAVIPPACTTGVPTSQCSTFAPQGVQADAKTPTVNEWNLSVEQQVAKSTALRVAYVGSFGYHGFVSIDPNDIPAQICSNAAGCTAGGTPGTVKSTVAQGAQYIPVQGRLNPFLGAGFFWYTEGNSSYNALQTEVTHRLAAGLQFRANYTWSKNLDMNSALTIAQSANEPQMIMDRNDLKRDWGPSALNPKHQASFSTRYELPFGHGKHWGSNLRGAGEKLVSGWQLNEIATLLSGFPFTPLIGANRSGDGDIRNPDRPVLNPSFTGPVILGHQGQWYNPNAFILPLPGTYGNEGRGVFTGPGLADLDVSAMKNTALSERVTLQFRAEFFNILNHTNLGPPNSTVFSGTLPAGQFPTASNFNASAGLITTLATTPRQIQFGLKLIF